MRPVLFTIGGLEFYSYGLMVGIGYVMGVLVASNMARKKGVNPDSLFGFFVVLLITGVAGGRLLHMALNTGSYQSLLDVFDLRDGGFSIHGVLLGGIIGAVVYCKVKKMRMGQLFDIVAPSAALGQSIGRLGCLLSGCCYGIPTGGKWGVTTRFAPGLRHPYPIYESIADFLLFAVLIKMSEKLDFEGGVFALYISGYAMIRFVLEFWRDSEGYMFGLSYAQWASAGLFAVALVAYVYLKRRVGAKNSF